MTLSIKKKTLRKVVSSLTMLATVVSMSGIMALSSVSIASAAVVDGSLIKSNATNSDGSPTLASLDVYIVKLVGTKKFKRLILNPTVFTSYGHLNWGNIQTVSQAVMDEYTTSALVRVDTDPAEKVYAMAPNGDIGSKSWVNLTSTAFLGVTGSDADAIYTINAVDGGNYTAVTDVTTTTQLATFYSAGTLPGVTPVPVTGGLSVALSANTPAATSVASGTAHNAVLKVSLTAGTTNIKVTGFKVTKSGFAANTVVSGVYVNDANGARHGNVISSLAADNSVSLSFASDPILVSAGTTTTATILFNNGSTGTSGTIAFGIASASDITSDASSVTGTFPINGNTMSLLSGTSAVATTTVDVQAVNSSGISYSVNTASAQDITKFRIVETSSNEGVNLSSIILWNNGNASATDYSDVELVAQDGTILATAQPVGQITTFVLASPYPIAKGQTKDFTVRAKIINGTTRTIQLVVYSDYDVVLTGMTTGAGILPTAGTTDTTFPIGDATNYNKVTIASGTLIFNRASDSPTTSMVPGANDVVLAKYIAKPIGENMELRQVSFGLDQDTGSIALSGTVYVKVNGAVVYSAAANTTNFPVVGTASARSLSSYPILTAGVDNVIEVSASVSSSATTSDAYFVNDFDLTSVKRLITNDILDPTVSVADGYTRSVQSGALTVTTLSTPVANSVVSGTNDFHFASFELNPTTSGEDVRVSTIIVTDTLGSGSDYSGVANLVIKNSAGTQIPTSSSTATNANTVTFNFQTPITVVVGTPVTVKLYGNVVSSTGTSHTFKIANAASVTSTGVTTGNAIGETVAGNGQTMTAVSGGTLALSNVSGSGYTPSLSQLVNINTTDGIYFAGRLTSQYEAQKVTSFTLNATGTALTQNNLTNIRLYAQTGTGALSGTAVPFATTNQFSSCSANVCTNTWTATDNLLPMTINPGTGVTIFAKADVQGEGTAKLGNDFYFSSTITASTGTYTLVDAACVAAETYTATINGTAIVYTATTADCAGADAADTIAVLAGLTAAINASATIGELVNAVDTANTITLTGTNPSVAGNYTTTASDTSTAGALVATAATLTGGVAGGITTKGAVSNSAPSSISGSAGNSSASTTIVPFNVIVGGEYPSSSISTTVVIGSQIARFKVTNNGSAQITLSNVKFAESGSHTGTDVTYSLYASSENSANYTGTLIDNDGTDNTAGEVDFGALDTPTTINGGSYRYITVTITAGATIAAGNSWGFSVGALGDLKYSVTEAGLGYDGEQDGDLTGTITALPVSGTPAVGTISKS